jgi:hypothetical protein
MDERTRRERCQVISVKMVSMRSHLAGAINNVEAIQAELRALDMDEGGVAMLLGEIHNKLSAAIPAATLAAENWSRRG